MALSSPIALRGVGQGTARLSAARVLHDRRADARRPDRLYHVIRVFTGEFDRQAAIVLLIGLVIVAWDIAVPLVGAQVIDAMARERPFEEIALVILGLAAVIWVPHGNLLPYALELYNLKRYRVRLLGRVAVRGMRMALLNPANLSAGAGARPNGDAQPILCEARENLGRIMERVVRDVPIAMRSLCVLGLLVWMVPLLVPFLLLGAAIDLAITWHMGSKLESHFRARQDAENAERRLEIELLSRHFGEPLSAAEAEAILAPYEAAVASRVAKEIAAEAPVLRYRLQRDLVCNATNITSWLLGAWYVVVAGNPLGSFLFFVAWSARAGEIFTVVMNLQQEVMKSRRSLEQLGELTGVDRPAGL